MKKLKKYSHIAGSVLSQGKPHSPGNFPKDAVMKAVLQVKKGNYNEEDQSKLAGLEDYRKQLAADHSEISYAFFGLDEKQKVSTIAQKAGSPRKWCEFFYFLTKFSRAENVLEIGTNLGVSGQYFLSGLTSGKSMFTTLEGVPGLCAIAAKRFGEITGPSQFKVVQGFYDSTLQEIADSKQKTDLVFFDGNHKYEPTLHYFNLLKNNYSKNAILIFDDIYWDGEMEKAWKELQDQPGVYCSIDFFKLGILLFDPEKAHFQKEHLKMFLAF